MVEEKERLIETFLGIRAEVEEGGSLDWSEIGVCWRAAIVVD